MLDQVLFERRVAVGRGFQQYLPLFAGAEFVEVPEHGGDWSDNLGSSGEPRTDR